MFLFFLKTQSQREIERLEKEAPALVKSKSEEQKKNTDLLNELDDLKLQIPNVKLPKCVPKISSVENFKPDTATKVVEDDDDYDDVEIISFGKKGIEVICLDDDDDE